MDDLHTVFVEPIAAGRGVSVEKVDNTFGRGATLLAEDALSRGMIDTILDSPVKLKAVPSPDPTTALEHTPMNLQELIAQHPETYAQAIAAGVEQGTTAERDRVSAHLTMGAGFNAMDIALAAVEDGSEMTAGLNAKYQTAGSNRDDTANRQADDAQAGGAADNADASASQATAAEAVTAGVEKMLGIVPATA